jgi:type I restriction enzyme S subunit
VIRVRTHKEIDPLFVCAQFHTPSIRRLVIESAGTGTITNVNQPALLRLPVIQPPYRLQQEFVRQAKQIESIQAQQTTATQKAEATFDALLARTFGGL